MARLSIWIAAVFCVSFVPQSTKADGGIIRLQQTQGSFSITLFSPPDLAVGRVADLSVLVQGTATAKPILDANVTFTFTPLDASATNQSDPICGMPQNVMRPATVHATREQASNKLLYAAPVIFESPGDWQLHVNVTGATDTAEFNCSVPVASKSGNLIHLWPYLLLPPLVVVTFAANQWLRRHSLQKIIYD